ncbi:MAG: tRNA pseudouridine(38-40) synthase TruA [Actinomycetota bacterium]|nr:tRNA pseudouridine(38-40) synthase TruA [Actinomycetota bacterium]
MTLFSDQSGPDAPTAVSEGPLQRVRLLVAYLGTGFRGFAAQPGQRTVAGVLGAALERHLRHTVELTCAGRTDAGVHAWGQVVSLEARADADLGALERSLNRALRPEVAIRAAAAAEPDFDARRSATYRRYRYVLLNRATPDPFRAGSSWQVETPLDLAAMRLACDPLLGEHDFGSFCRRPTASASLSRRVRDARWVDEGDGVLRFEIEASSFCHQMVRSVVGTLVEVGRGKKKAGEMSAIIAARDRGAAGTMAPAHGLCLWEVGYEPLGRAELWPGAVTG